MLVTGDPETVTPENFAIAINENCTSCETLASAYQWVLGTDEENVRFSPEGRHAINEIRKELRGLGRSDLPVDELQARVHQLMVRLGEVLRTELEPVGKPPENRGAGDRVDADAHDDNGADRVDSDRDGRARAAADDDRDRDDSESVTRALLLLLGVVALCRMRRR